MKYFWGQSKKIWTLQSQLPGGPRVWCSHDTNLKTLTLSNQTPRGEELLEYINNEWQMSNKNAGCVFLFPTAIGICSQSLYYSKLQSSLPISSLITKVLNGMPTPNYKTFFEGEWMWYVLWAPWSKRIWISWRLFYWALALSNIYILIPNSLDP